MIATGILLLSKFELYLLSHFLLQLHKMDLQRAPAAPKDHQRTFSPSSQQDSRPVDIPSLLNPVKCEDRLIASSAAGSLSLPSINTDPLILSRPDTQSLSLARTSPYRQVGQEAPYPQAQNCERPHGVNP